MTKPKPKQNTAKAKDSKTALLPAPLVLIAAALTRHAVTDPRTLDFLALPLVVRRLDHHDTEIALWPRVIAARLKQVEDVGLDKALESATPAEVLAFMESITRITPPDDAGIMVGVFAHAMYLMLISDGYPADQLPPTVQQGVELTGDAATTYNEITVAIRAAQRAHQDDVLPTTTWVGGDEQARVQL